MRFLLGCVKCIRPPQCTAVTLTEHPPPLVDATFAAAVFNRATPSDAFDHSEALIRELEQADTLVIATPMHNYTVPAVLKAWIDQVVRINRTFASRPTGKAGLLRDRLVLVVIASGSWFSGPSPTGTPAQPDFLTHYLRAILGTIGLNDIHFLTLEVGRARACHGRTRYGSGAEGAGRCSDIA